MDREKALERSLEYFDGDKLAAGVYLDKYALTTPEGDILEPTPEEMHHRLAREFARIEAKYPNPLTEEEIFRLFDKFKFLIPQGSPMSGIGNPYQIQSVSNCFTLQSPFDSYSGILKTDQEIVHLMRRRGGVGFDISTIRPKGLPTSNAAKTTDGVGVFMERYSNTTREVAQGGRRGALILTISVHHPEIETFINIKRDRKKVTGANVSIRLSDEFMEAVKNETQVELRFPVDSPTPIVRQMVDAKSLWNKIVESAHENAEPGLLFWDTVKRETPTECYEDFKSVGVNPCCLAGDTKISLNCGVYPIKDLVGKEVVCVLDSRLSWKNVFSRPALVISKGQGQVYELTVTNTVGSSTWSIKTTHEHMFSTPGGWVKLKDLKPGDEILQGNRNPSYEEGFDLLAKVVSVEYVGQEEVFDIVETDTHSFIANGLVVHNSEIVLSPYDSCRLMILNTLSFVGNPFTSTATFNKSLFRTCVRLAQRLMDDLVDLELESIDKILEKVVSDPEPEDVKQIEYDLWQKVRGACERGRRTGLGVTAIGDTLAALGIRYGSDESIEKTDQIYSLLADGAYAETVNLAKERGPFPAFNYELEKEHPFLKRVFGRDENLANDWEKHGRRNIALTTSAPAGSVSVLTQTTSGIEPAFEVVYKRRRKIMGDEKNVRVDFIDELGDKWQEYEVYHHQYKKWIEITGKTGLENSPYWKASAMDLDWMSSVRLQAAAQKHICHAISRTCNLPSDASVELVGQIYMAAWEAGCKGFTVYRDGSRSGVLISSEKPVPSEKPALSDHHAPKRPKELDCDVINTTVKGEKWTFFMGKMDDRPYEIMGGLSRFVTMPKRVKHGKIVKYNGEENPIARYDFHYDYEQDIEEETVIKDISTMFENATNASFTRTISLALRHGTPVQYIVEQLLKGSEKDDDLFSFSRAVSRVLKYYIKDGTKTSEKTCPSCGSTEMVYQEGCSRCVSCGNSKCG